MKCISFILIIILINPSADCQRVIHKGKDTSFDSLLYLKGKESKGRFFPAINVSNKDAHFENSQLLHKITFINFWFKACPPCIAEMQALNELYDGFANNKGFQYLSFTFENEKTIEEMKKKYHIHYPIFSISKTDCYKFNQGNGFPTSLIINEKGIIEFLLTGYTTDVKNAHERLFKEFYPKIKSDLIHLRN